MRILLLVAGLALAGPALAEKAEDKKPAKDQAKADDEIGKSLDELKASLERLGMTLGSRVDGEAAHATTLLTQEVGELSKALESSEAPAKARAGVASALKNLSQALDRAAQEVKKDDAKKP